MYDIPVSKVELAWKILPQQCGTLWKGDFGTLSKTSLKEELKCAGNVEEETYLEGGVSNGCRQDYSRFKQEATHYVLPFLPNTVKCRGQHHLSSSKASLQHILPGSKTWRYHQILYLRSPAAAIENKCLEVNSMDAKRK